MNTAFARYRLNEALASLLAAVAQQFGVTVEPFTTAIADQIDAIEPDCHLVFIEFPVTVDTIEVIRVRHWCLANPSHTLIAVFQSAEQYHSNTEVLNFVDDYIFANSSPEQISLRFGFALNVQTRKQHKIEQIRQSISVDELMQSDYASILGSLAEGVVYQGPNDEVLYANDAACRFLALTMDQLKGKTSYDPRWSALKEDGTPFLPGEHPSAITLRTGKALSEVFMSIRHGADAMRQMTINTQPLFASNSDKATGVIVSFRDITGVLEARKERDEMRDQLLQSQKIEALGTLAGGIAHDFNNLLTPILGLSQKLILDSSSSDLVHQLSVIEANALSARDLINQILTFSRKKPDLMVRINLSKVVQSVSVMVEEFADNNVTKSFDFEDQ
jgi:nitrogen fixation/metabolism regulation signal transduction histidine kinase